jgi:hypothetical protein
MLFQGQEFCASSPFLYFADLNADIARLMRSGRVNFLKQFTNITSPEVLNTLDDPGNEATFLRSKLDHAEREKHREHRYEIFPDSGFYREVGRDTTFATVLDPLDDAAFLYWIRTVPLEVGKRYEYARYFRPDRNPVIIEVLGYDKVSVAGKKWRALVVRPKIPQGRGIFAEKSETRIWLSDDKQRLVLAIQSNFSFGQVTLKLKDYVVPGEAQR